MVDNHLLNKMEISFKNIIYSFFGFVGREWDSVKSIFIGNPFLFSALILGLLLRLFLAPFLGHPYDLRIFMAVGWAVANGITPYGKYVLQTIFTEVSHPHLTGSFYGIGYPPLWGLVLGSAYRLYSILSPNNIYLYILTLKLPIIVGDIVVSIVLYKIIEREVNTDIASKVFLFYQFCPFIIIAGVVWGMFDMLVFLFSIISAYTLFSRSDLSAVSLSIATSLKPYVIILIPLYAIFIIKKFNSIHKTSRYLFIVLSLLVLGTLIPMFIYGWPLSNLYCALTSHMTTTNFYYEGGNDYTYGAASPFNLYNVLRLVDPGIKPLNFLNYLWIGVCLATYVYVFLKSNTIHFKSIVNYSFLTSLAFFSTRFWVSEQNLIFLLSFFILTVVLSGKQREWRTIHILWILLVAFIIVHVPVTSFLWIIQPRTLNVATAFCNGPLGYVRWISMSLLTFSWLAILYWYSFKERGIWQG